MVWLGTNLGIVRSVSGCAWVPLMHRQSDGALHVEQLFFVLWFHGGAGGVAVSRRHVLRDGSSCERQLSGRVHGGVRVSRGVHRRHGGGVSGRDAWCEWAWPMPGALHGGQVRAWRKLCLCCLWVGLVCAGV